MRIVAMLLSYKYLTNSNFLRNLFFALKKKKISQHSNQIIIIIIIPLPFFTKYIITKIFYVTLLFKNAAFAAFPR